MQLFDSISSESFVSPQNPHATPDVYNTQRDIEKGSWKDKLEDSSA